MQSTLSKEDMDNQFNLVTMSELFEMPNMSGVPAYGNISTPSPNLHSRSISSESGSSLAELAHPVRTHPSLSGYSRTRATPDGYIPHDAPTQQRRYVTPSATSRKEVPSYMAAPSRRRPAVQSDEEDELAEEPLRENATDQEKIEYKRRQNTLAARRSRRRRMAQFQKLEEDVVRLTREKDIWKERALMMERMLSTHGLPCPNFDR